MGLAGLLRKLGNTLPVFFINCCIVNAYIIYSEVSQRETKKGYKHLDFRLELAKQLIGNFAGRKRKSVAGVPNNNALHGIENVPHVNVHMQKPRGVRCKWHNMQGARRETVRECQTCNIHLCQEVCHHAYHEHAKRQRIQNDDQ